MEEEHRIILEHAKDNKDHYKKIIEMIDKDRDSRLELIASGYTEDEAFKTLFIINGEFLSTLV
ncbi:hypothetical protein [Paenilisteria rocourtiae]|uniref:Uncharacterized protein n=1 Tax=Listeria rocourtiae TaxID=647910 RepID=A0A4R6ZMT6_9LIST|nr:hypothetical protein [Listeria rocourtiae]EUJ51563.1 hypothetical protein PROCOU_01689 [Listeria rocourtiae FSL F6-920]TDR53685.1 hypothetical protein DFP96_104279 [Listeria rocourtiae]